MNISVHWAYSVGFTSDAEAAEAAATTTGAGSGYDEGRTEIGKRLVQGFPDRTVPAAQECTTVVASVRLPRPPPSWTWTVVHRPCDVIRRQGGKTRQFSRRYAWQIHSMRAPEYPAVVAPA